MQRIQLPACLEKRKQTSAENPADCLERRFYLYMNKQKQTSAENPAACLPREAEADKCRESSCLPREAVLSIHDQLSAESAPTLCTQEAMSLRGVYPYESRDGAANIS